MARFLKWTGLILFAGSVGLALAVLFVAGARTQTPVAVVQNAVTQATSVAPDSYPWGHGYWRDDSATGVYTPNQPFPYGYGHGPGMMGQGWSAYDNGVSGMGPTMMGSHA